MVKIVIMVQGGIVDKIISSEPVEVAVVDYDIEGADENQLRMIPQMEPVGPESEQALASIQEAEVDAGKVDRVFQSLDR